MWMAPAGHSAAQTPQPRQTSRRTSGFPSESATAPKGQSSTQARQRRQASGVIMATISLASSSVWNRIPAARIAAAWAWAAVSPRLLG